MSFNRVHQFIRRNPDKLTFVCVKRGRAQCIAVHGIKAEQKINRIMLGFYVEVKPVGFYDVRIDEVELQQDLTFAGVGT